MATPASAAATGLLIHPTIGASRVGPLSSGTAVHWARRLVIEVEFEFIEAGAAISPLTVIATVVSVLAAADSALTVSSISFAAVATQAAELGPRNTSALID